MRVQAGLESLRRRPNFHVVRDALVVACERFGARIVHFSVLSNHIHLVCETQDERSLARAMQGLCVRIARGLNRLWDRVGAVFEDRYHARALPTPREVKNVLNYVLHNAHHHGSALRGPDPCSSGIWFEGWERILHDDPLRGPSPLARACTWLLSVGWKRHGLLRFAGASG